MPDDTRAVADPSDSDVPVLVDFSWFLNLPLAHKEIVGPGDVRFYDADKALLFYVDGTVRFRHRCDRGDRGVIVCAPALQLDEGGHRITGRDPVMEKVPVTVEPSILCSDCGTHGFVRNGRWSDA